MLWSSKEVNIVANGSQLSHCYKQGSHKHKKKKEQNKDSGFVFVFEVSVRTKGL